jgi:hypothetical protein
MSIEPLSTSRPQLEQRLTDAAIVMLVRSLKDPRSREVFKTISKDIDRYLDLAETVLFKLTSEEVSPEDRDGTKKFVTFLAARAKEEESRVEDVTQAEIMASDALLRLAIQLQWTLMVLIMFFSGDVFAREGRGIGQWLSDVYKPLLPRSYPEQVEERLRLQRLERLERDNARDAWNFNPTPQSFNPYYSPPGIADALNGFCATVFANVTSLLPTRTFETVEAETVTDWISAFLASNSSSIADFVLVAGGGVVLFIAVILIYKKFYLRPLSTDEEVFVEFKKYASRAGLPPQDTPQTPQDLKNYFLTELKAEEYARIGSEKWVSLAEHARWLCLDWESSKDESAVFGEFRQSIGPNELTLLKNPTILKKWFAQLNLTEYDKYKEQEWAKQAVRLGWGKRGKKEDPKLSPSDEIAKRFLGSFDLNDNDAPAELGLVLTVNMPGDELKRFLSNVSRESFTYLQENHANFLQEAMEEGWTFTISDPGIDEPEVAPLSETLEPEQLDENKKTVSRIADFLQWSRRGVSNVFSGISESVKGSNVFSGISESVKGSIIGLVGQSALKALRPDQLFLRRVGIARRDFEGLERNFASLSERLRLKWEQFESNQERLKDHVKRSENEIQGLRDDFERLVNDVRTESEEIMRLIEEEKRQSLYSEDLDTPARLLGQRPRKIQILEGLRDRALLNVTRIDDSRTRKQRDEKLLDLSRDDYDTLELLEQDLSRLGERIDRAKDEFDVAYDYFISLGTDNPRYGDARRGLESTMEPLEELEEEAMNTNSELDDMDSVDPIVDIEPFTDPGADISVMERLIETVLQVYLTLEQLIEVRRRNKADRLARERTQHEEFIRRIRKGEGFGEPTEDAARSRAKQEEEEAARRKEQENRKLVEELQELRKDPLMFKVYHSWKTKYLNCVHGHRFLEFDNVGGWQCFQHALPYDTTERVWPCCENSFEHQGCVRADHRTRDTPYSDEQTITTLHRVIVKRLGANRHGFRAPSSYVRYDRDEHQRRIREASMRSRSRQKYQNVNRSRGADTVDILMPRLLRFDLSSEGEIIVDDKEDIWLWNWDAKNRPYIITFPTLSNTFAYVFEKTERSIWIKAAELVRDVELLFKGGRYGVYYHNNPRSDIEFTPIERVAQWEESSA